MLLINVMLFLDSLRKVGYPSLEKKNGTFTYLGAKIEN